MKVVFFKRNEHKKFEYKPLYYNERKEELEKRREKFRRPKGEFSKEDLKEELHYRWGIHRKTYTKKKNDKSTLIYILVIAVLVYLIFFANIFSK